MTDYICPRCGVKPSRVRGEERYCAWCIHEINEEYAKEERTHVFHVTYHYVSPTDGYIDSDVYRKQRGDSVRRVFSQG